MHRRSAYDNNTALFRRALPIRSRTVASLEDLYTDELSQSSEPKCTPKRVAELIQLLSSLIPQFELLKAYTSLHLFHPDLAFRNILFDPSSLAAGAAKITGVIDWGGAQILPLMLTAVYPDGLMRRLSI